MYGIKVENYGGPEVLKLSEISLPNPSPNEVLVKVKAIGVNFVDIYQRKGLYPEKLPFVLGREGAGVVEAVGSNVSSVKVGDRVGWAGTMGSYATHVLVQEESLVRLPEKISFEEAAAILLQGMTAHYLSHATYPLKPGDSCLVHAAGGGVGQLLCQMAKMRGAFVIGTVSSQEKAELAKAAGADAVILYTQEDFALEVRKITHGKGVNVVYDSVGKNTFEKSLDALAIRGYLVLFGQSSGPVPPFDAQILNAKGSLFLTRPTLAHYTKTREELLERANFVFDTLLSGKLKLRIDRTFPLAEAREAHNYLESRKATGKILLIP
jgi:NADPH2:quinone reductase